MILRRPRGADAPSSSIAPRRPAGARQPRRLRLHPAERARALVGRRRRHPRRRHRRQRHHHVRPIGEDFWTGGGVTAKKVTAQLRAIGDRPVEVQINSFGGDMFEGIAIYNVLREHPQPVTVKVMGMAASAASIIAMAGDTVEIGAASFVMIHNCWVVAMGNRHDMIETAQWLEPFDFAMRDVYAARTGQKPDAVQKWLDARPSCRAAPRSSAASPTPCSPPTR
jgi:ATP-dependent protease ClpP protease subunit